MGVMGRAMYNGDAHRNVRNLLCLVTVNLPDYNKNWNSMTISCKIPPLSNFMKKY